MRRSLSVSPIGSSPLQRSISSRSRPSARVFQYPQSDRALCNLLGGLGAGIEVLSLSVSPIGSSPLQLTTAVGVSVGIEAFSIPNRIEPSATGASDPQLLMAWSFSIPNRIEPSATEPSFSRVQVLGKRLSVSPIGSSPLQLQIRVGCKPGRLSFSIPNRIEPSATA